MNPPEVWDEILKRCTEIGRKIDRIAMDLDKLKKHSNMANGEILHDFNDLCQILKISVRQVRRYCNNGELSGIKIGKRRLWRDSEIQAFMQRRRSETDD